MRGTEAFGDIDRLQVKINLRQFEFERKINKMSWDDQRAYTSAVS